MNKKGLVIAVGLLLLVGALIVFLDNSNREITGDLVQGQGCSDKDGDGHAGNGFFCFVYDCDENNVNVYPNAPEICDGIDNQCWDGEQGYGSIDEGCSCYYSGMPNPYTKSCILSSVSGACDGIQSCGIKGGWSICSGTIPPSTLFEICDGLDNDCDGNLDVNEYSYSTGTEICDGLDNDCDGSVDENNVCSVCGNNVVDPGEQCDDGNLLNGDCCTSTCQNEPAGNQVCGFGLCQANLAACSNGVPLICNPFNAFAEPENTDASCSDGLDNDCDSYADCDDLDCNGLGGCSLTLSCGPTSDSDGGLIYTIEGTVFADQGNYTDSCSGNTLTEYTCFNQQLNETNYDCSDSYFKCQDGACITCDQYEGDLSASLMAKGTNDQCIIEYNEQGLGVIKEYSCKDDSSGEYASAVLCPSGSPRCYDGACRSCIDFDSPPNYGGNFTVAGITWNDTYAIGDGKKDFCSGNNLTEYYCNGAEVVSESKDCSTISLTSQYTCLDGACVCIPSPVSIPQEACQSDETQEVSVEDANGCQESYLKKTYCDYNNNGLIGDLCTLGVGSAFIGNSLLNASINYTGLGLKKVDLKKNNASVQFNWHFSSVLNLCEVEVDTAGPNDDSGYIIVRGLDVPNKTIVFDRLNNSNNRVCIKDVPGLVDISEFSVDCNSTGEVLVDCPGSTNVSGYIYNCALEDSGTKFKVWPLKHSAVLSMSGGDACTPDWINSTSWGDCINGTQYRNVTDLNNCQDDRIEGQICGVAPVSCSPNWDHASWAEIECIDGFKTRTVMDLEDCSDDSNKPNETIQCIEEAPNLLFILIIVGALLIILGIVAFIKWRKNKEEFVSPVALPEVAPPIPPAVASATTQATSAATYQGYKKFS